MTTHAIIFGTAFLDTLTGGEFDRVRYYYADDGTRWVGHDTSDVEYLCSHLCQSDRLRGLVSSDEQVSPAGSIVFPRLNGMTLDWGAWPCPDWPDYDVYCAQCATQLHKEDDDE